MACSVSRFKFPLKSLVIFEKSSGSTETKNISELEACTHKEWPCKKIVSTYIQYLFEVIEVKVSLQNLTFGVG